MKITNQQHIYLLYAAVFVIIVYQVIQWMQKRTLIRENLQIAANEVFEKGGVNQLVPPGTIVAYYPRNGDLKSNPVPSGWVVCDGNNGTPDLRGRFLRMYSDDMIPNRNEIKQYKMNVGHNNDWSGYARNKKYTSMFSHKLGEYAGSDQQELEEVEMPRHTHPYYIWNPFHSTGGRGYQSACMGRSCAARSVSASTDTEPVGGSWAHNNQPPYYVVVFIMKQYV